VTPSFSDEPQNSSVRCLADFRCSRSLPERQRRAPQTSRLLYRKLRKHREWKGHVEMHHAHGCVLTADNHWRHRAKSTITTALVSLSVAAWGEMEPRSRIPLVSQVSPESQPNTPSCIKSMKAFLTVDQDSSHRTKRHTIAPASESRIRSPDM
jgi:hypothetical protein